MTAGRVRCATPGCGAILSQYSADPVCWSCNHRLVSEWIVVQAERARRVPPPPPVPPEPVCRREGCANPICTRSIAASNAPRWRRLCDHHYDEQRKRQSHAGLIARAKALGVPPETLARPRASR